MPRRKLIRQFQELDPNTPEEVHEIWFTVHILCMSTAAICGAITAYWFGLCLDEFDFRCFLFATFYAHSSDEEKSLIDYGDSMWNTTSNFTGENFQYDHTKWGADKECDSFQFIHICSMLSAIIWLIFLILPNRDKKKESQIFEKPHRLMFPMLVWSSIYSCVIIFANSTLFSGLEELCFNIKTSHKIQMLTLYVYLYRSNRTKCSLGRWEREFSIF
ncbi:hypothetical protein WA026_013709 [Henosepilachna vigintioctopunctata]|uniref:Uncharacterized protein n=1 Tax=Henosepilachna vigintioctopunctata TaxID=420089 RepID=A0AAW1UQT7_9CUCU